MRRSHWSDDYFVEAGLPLACLLLGLQRILNAEGATGARDTWADEANYDRHADKPDFDISVLGLGKAMAERPIEPYWQMLRHVQAAVAMMPNQRLRGISGEEWAEIADPFGPVRLFDATRMKLPSTLAEWHATSEAKAGFKLQLKLDARTRQLQKVLFTTPTGNDNDFFDDRSDRKGGMPGR